MQGTDDCERRRRLIESAQRMRQKHARSFEILEAYDRGEIDAPKLKRQEEQEDGQSRT